MEQPLAAAAEQLSNSPLVVAAARNAVNHRLGAALPRVREITGTLIRCRGLDARVGEMCLLLGLNDSECGVAEVVGFSEHGHLLAPLGPLTAIGPTTRVKPLGRAHSVLAGDHLLGQVLDGFGRPLLDRGEADNTSGAEAIPAVRRPPLSIDRPLIDESMSVGVRAIDGLLACGRGQRAGIFAPAGCGKSTLLGMIARNADTDIIVVGLIGERGREVNEFLERQIDPETRSRTVVICATSDCAAAERVRAADVATTIAEYFTDQGKRVLLLIDSVTRYARALRELGLATGEPPARRGYPPSVFAALPRLVERAGPRANGFLTAFYTILEEDPEGGDPISEEVRSLLDGHIVLSRRLADSGHFPAIDILASVSRVMPQTTNSAHQQNAAHVRDLMEKYRNIEVLVQVGEYKEGTDALGDEAIQKYDAIRSFLRQPVEENIPFAETLTGLERLCGR